MGPKAVCPLSVSFDEKPTFNRWKHMERTVYTLAPPELRGRATGGLQFFIGSSMVGHWMTGLLFQQLGSAVAMQVMAVQAIFCLGLLGMLWFRLAHGGR
jgi:hypothetical protein